MKKIFASKTEMSKQFYKIVLTYIRKIRAFLFRENQPVEATNLNQIDTTTPTPKDIPVLLNEIFLLFEHNRDISISKLGKISKAFDFCLKRLSVKLDADTNLQESEYFQICLDRMKQTAKDFNDRIIPRQLNMI